eukprot:1157358-Pelagomonas_calceolata.AAC.8
MVPLTLEPTTPASQPQHICRRVQAARPPKQNTCVLLPWEPMLTGVEATKISKLSHTNRCVLAARPP